MLADGETEGDADIDELGEADAVPLADDEIELDGDELGLLDTDAEGVTDAEDDGEDEIEALGEVDTEADGDALGLLEIEADGVRDSDELGEALGVIEADEDIDTEGLELTCVPAGAIATVIATHCSEAVIENAAVPVALLDTCSS